MGHGTERERIAAPAPYLYGGRVRSDSPYRRFAYILVKKMDFKSVHIGTAIWISIKSFDKWLDIFDL